MDNNYFTCVAATAAALLMAACQPVDPPERHPDGRENSTDTLQSFSIADIDTTWNGSIEINF